MMSYRSSILFLITRSRVSRRGLGGISLTTPLVQNAKQCLCKSYRSLIIFLILFSLTGISASAQLHRAEKVYSKVSAAVVQIINYDKAGRQLSQASGVYLKDKNCVVTNYHVWPNADVTCARHGGIYIKLDSIITFDEEKDILILAVGAPHSKEEEEYRKSIPELKYAEVKNLKIGERVYAIGSPLNLENTLSEGLVSGLRQSKDSLGYLIQITAPFSPGSSGGAVVDAHGDLIGISTFIISGNHAQNLNFVISIDEVLSVFEPQALANYQNVHYQHHLNEAYKFMNEGNYRQAISGFRSALSLRVPEDNSIYFYLGECFRNYNTDSATYYYMKALAMQQDVRNNIALAAIYQEQNDQNAALFYYKHATFVDFSFVPALIGVVSHYLAVDSLRPAWPFIIKLNQVGQMSSDANMLLAEVAMKQEQYFKAIEYFNKVLQLNPNSGGAYFGLSKMYEKIGDANKAAEYEKKAFQVDPMLQNSLPGYSK